MLSLIKKVLNRNYYSLNLIEINRKQLIDNYHHLYALNPQLRIAPVLKSNAYGHGLTQIAKILDTLNPVFFCVDSLYEAYELLKIKIKTSILIMGYINPHNLSIKKLPFSYAVYDVELLKTIAKYQPHASIHLFVDTGMHREGILMDDLPSFLKCLKKYPYIKIDGLMSHLASPDKINDPLTVKQLKNFESAYQMIKANGHDPKYIHLNASAGLINSKYFNKSFIGNIARPGLALYMSQPILRLTSHLIQIKNIKKGEKVGYDFTYTAKKDMKIGILPLGYNDGVDRRLSNKYPIVGRVSMNIIAIDITHIRNPRIGDEIIIFSSDKNSPNSIQNISRSIDTIPYELLIHLHPSIKRVVI